MALPNVNMAFAPGNQLQGAAVANIDNVFMVVGAASRAIPNTIIPIVDPNTVASLGGYGPAPELCAQILANGAGVVYLVAGNKSVVDNGTYTYGVGAPVRSRPAAPAMSACSLVGLPGLPLQPGFTNTGAGSVSFDSNTNVQSATGSNAVDTVSVLITTAGPLGTAQATITVGANTSQNQVLQSTPWTQPSVGQPVLLDFNLPLGGQFQQGDYFSAAPTPNDSYNVLVTINNINQYGQALFTYSLDGGVTTSGQLNAPLGGVINISSGAPVAAWGNTEFPASVENVSLLCEQAGTLTGAAFQIGSVTQVGSGTGTVGVNSGSFPSPGGWTTPQTYVLNVKTTDPVSSATGWWTLNGAAFSGSGSSGSPITIGATFTDSENSITFDMANDFVANTTYTVTIQPQALFSQTINGASPTTVSLPADGVLSGFGGPTLQFNIASVDQYPVGMTYQFCAYPQFTYTPQERDGSYVGLAFTFGFGIYQNGDTYQLQCAAPYVANADALNALSVITTNNGYEYSMVQLYTGCIDPDGNTPDWATAMDLAESVNAALLALVPAPAFEFKRAFICGPDATSATSGATPNDFVLASGSLSLDRVMTGAGADCITSALTGRQDLRNHGVAAIAQLAAIPVQTDPGEYTLGPLNNVVSTTTPAADATTFNGNRAMVARTFKGISGVFEAQGLTLSTAGGDYSTVMNCRVIDKAAYYAQQALLPYGVNRTVPTVPGKGTLTPAFAAILNNDVGAQTTKSCPGNFQNITVSASTTDVLIPSGTESVTIAIQPWGYINTINATIGFTL